MTTGQPEPREGVEDDHLSSAEDLLDALSPRAERWAPDPTQWIFRGQANSSWTLKAKAVRGGAAEFAKYAIRTPSLRPGYDGAGAHDWSTRQGLQERLLERFRDGLNRSGLTIPTQGPAVTLLETGTWSSGAEPPRQSFPLMALAQHHGLPTMLLDWTRRAWVAAYFAAAEASDPERRAGATHLAVWALRRAGLRDSSEGPNFYDAPGSTNPNLAAQAGLFTILSHGEDDPSLEEHFVRLRRLGPVPPTLRRLTLPVDEAPKLLRLLSYEGIDGASMFPGADGVAKAMRESVYWDLPPR